jgi:hypothetical protein
VSDLDSETMTLAIFRLETTSGQEIGTVRVAADALIALTPGRR